MSFGYVHLPEEFTKLLQLNMQTTGKGYALLKKELWQKPSFQATVLRACGDLEHEITFEKVINSVGWFGLRDRLACLYLYHQKEGHFPKVPPLNEVDDLLEFESRFSKISLDGFGRSFLLGFYIKMGLYKHQSDEESLGGHLSQGVAKVLRSVTTRSERSDWLCLSLHFFVKYLGEEKVSVLLSSGGGFASLLKELKKPQHYAMTKSLLAYGASIGDEEAFFNQAI